MNVGICAILTCKGNKEDDIQLFDDVLNKLLSSLSSYLSTLNENKFRFIYLNRLTFCHEINHIHTVFIYIIKSILFFFLLWEVNRKISSYYFLSSKRIEFAFFFYSFGTFCNNLKIVICYLLFGKKKTQPFPFHVWKINSSKIRFRSVFPNTQKKKPKVKRFIFYVRVWFGVMEKKKKS